MLFVPPLAHLPRAREGLDTICTLLDRSLEPARRFRRVSDKGENDLRTAVALHAVNALDAARAIHLLSGTDYAGTISPHFRTIFEILVKIRWMRKEPRRASSYLESEPFERYVLATPRIKCSPRWQSVIDDCKKAIEQNKALLKLTGAHGKAARPDFKAIARALRMPGLSQMAHAIGMDLDDYLVDSDVPSLTPHTSVVHTKNFVKSMNSDGTFMVSTTLDPITLLGYVTRSAARSGEILKEILDVFPDGAIMLEAEAAASELAGIVKSISGLMSRS